jgi:hypothetical protein
MLMTRVDGPAPGAGTSHSNTDALPFLALGKGPPLVPGLNGAALPGAHCAAIVLVGPIEPAVLADALDAAPDPAVPIVDLGGNAGLRSDHAADTFDPALLDELRQRFAPILRRLEAIPFHGAREDRPELTILRLAYSRNIAIAAAFDPASPNLVEYPLLGRAAAQRQRLEGLATLELLRRRHFTRTHLCGRCDSARLHAFEACPGCGGADLTETPIVHHYRCGWQEPEPRFVKDRALVCPKCRRELRHYGVDYDKPGSVLVCRTCQQGIRSRPCASPASTAAMSRRPATRARSTGIIASSPRMGCKRCATAAFRALTLATISTATRAPLRRANFGCSRVRASAWRAAITARSRSGL